MRVRPSPSAGPVLGLLLVVLLAGCGSSGSGNGIASKTPQEILARAKALADDATSVHVAGSITSGGMPITFDLQVLAGEGGRGQLAENGLSFELIQTRRFVYIKGSPAFYTHIGGAAAAQVLQGKWLKAPTASSEFASLASLTDLRQLVDTTLADHETLSRGAVTTVDGHKAIAVNDTSQGGTIYIATTGPPYPIEVTKAGSGGGTITFNQWNQPVTLTAPASAIDITQLRSGH
jgi:hypothetical protein